MYWLSAVSVFVFGLKDWAVRLPNAIFSLFLILLIFRFGLRFLGERAGFYSGIVIATCLGHYAFTRIFLPDAMISFFIAFSLYMYLRISIEDQDFKRIGPIDIRCVALYISVALAVLTKGLIGLIFTGTIIFMHVAATGNWKVLRRLQLSYGIIIFLMVAAPWHVAAAMANSDFLWFYFVREHFLRYIGKRYPRDYSTVPRYLFWGLHLVWLFPWTAFIWGLVRHFPGSLRPKVKTAQVGLFLFLWIGVIIGFYSFGSTMEYYTFPTLAAFALLLGKAMAELEETSSLPAGHAGDNYSRANSPKWGIAGLGCMAVFSTLTGLVMIALIWLGNHRAANSLSATLTTNPESYRQAFGHILDLTPASFRVLAPLVCGAAAFLIIFPSAAFFLALRRRWVISFLLLAAMMIGLCHLYNDGMVAFEPVLSSKNLAETIQRLYHSGDKIVINDFYEKGSTLNYYTGIQVNVIDGLYGVLWYGLQDEAAPRLAMTEDDLLNEWSSAKRIFLFSEKEPLDSFLSRHPLFDYQVLAEEGGKKILTNR